MVVVNDESDYRKSTGNDIKDRVGCLSEQLCGCLRGEQAVPEEISVCYAILLRVGWIHSGVIFSQYGSISRIVKLASSSAAQILESGLQEYSSG